MDEEMGLHGSGVGCLNDRVMTDDDESGRFIYMVFCICL